MNNKFVNKELSIKLLPYSGTHWVETRTTVPTINLRFETFFHSHVAEFIRGLNRKGIPGLLNLANQTLGNPYLHSPWKFGYIISTTSSGPACIIEGGFSKDAAKGRPGNFEAVVLEGNNLQHYWHDSSDVTKPWAKAGLITNLATGPASIIQRQQSPILEVVVLEDDKLQHYSNANVANGQPWVPQAIVSDEVSGPGCVIESSFKTLEAIALKGSGLVHYRLDNGKWVQQGEPITKEATGPGCIIQSSIKQVEQGEHGNFEVVVLEGNQLVHYWKHAANNAWRRGAIITDAATSAGWMIQSRIRDGVHGNFEVVVCEGSQLVHYWKDNSDLSNPWRRGRVITTKASGPGCIIHGSFGSIGNFEVVVPEHDRLVHYWNVNEGPIGNEGERFYFWNTYRPTKYVDDPYPRHDLDFSYGGAYSLYNWEIFFHAPLMLATRLSKNQRFADAMRWYHYIFDPTDDSHELTTHRYWKVLPLRDVEKQRIDHMLAVLSDTEKKNSPEQKKIKDQIEDWRKHPFQPHRIARMRLIAYQKNTVMKYIDNLIAWGDQLFGRDSIKSINEATQLYVLAANLLGSRPRRVPRRGKIKPQTYAQLQLTLDDFSNTKRALENEFPISSSFGEGSVSAETTALLGMGDTFYFCIPQNDKLLEYWDKVADRLFKIRHCMNIEGVVRQLPLFEPPIDPALLVQAAAQGVDIGSVLNDLSSSTPHFRFAYILQKALELCSDLKSLGSALLSALEKQDAEELAATRGHQELQILNLVKNIKEQQHKEAVEAYNALLKSREAAVGRFLDYQKLLGVQDPKAPDEEAGQAPVIALPGKIAEAGLPLLEEEQGELDKSHSARDWQVIASTAEITASVLNAIPNFSVRVAPMGVGASASFGGSSWAAISSSIARYQQRLSAQDTYDASHAGRIASHIRQQQERSLQSNQAARDIIQINKQLVAAKIREDIALQELKNHDRLIENAQEIDEFLRNKYTNEELYSWMQGEISAVYFQCYQMAYDLAKKAEKTFRFERGLTTSNFIQFGYWDSLRKGLLSGERLYLTLKQMEQAYLEQNKREYEITKHVSLLMNDPIALIKLKETGQCEIFLPEALFDADYPGHYMRRVKSASLTIPCVVGPYTSINCTLTLLSNKTRIKGEVGVGYQEDLENEDTRFVSNFAAMQSIATSHAQNDSGMFELNFRDERYLPFEGAGVISRWRIDMQKDCNAFDFETLTDVVLHLKYTAREGGEMLGRAAKKDIQDAIGDAEKSTQARLFSLRHEFPSEWHRLQSVADNNGDHKQAFSLHKQRFPFLFQGNKKQITVNSVELFGVPKTEAVPTLRLTLTDPEGQPVNLQTAAGIGLLVHRSADVNLEVKELGNDRNEADWTIEIKMADIPASLDQLEDILVLCYYSVQDA